MSGKARRNRKKNKLHWNRWCVRSNAHLRCTCSAEIKTTTMNMWKTSRITSSGWAKLTSGTNSHRRVADLRKNNKQESARLKLCQELSWDSDKCTQIVENVKHAFLIRFYNCKKALEWIAVRTETQKRAIKNYRYAHNNNSTIYWLVVIECWEMQWMHAIMQQKWSEWGKTVANTADLSMQSMMTSIIAFVASFVVGLCKLAKW